jgi:3-deoxy-manno-octulosonate cytidylyltransferase (CMP-KDO synthetase)
MAREKVLGVIPCRLESSRFPGKALVPIAGDPLIVHVLRRLSAAASIDRVIVATDSDEVARVVASNGGSVAMVTQVCATGTDRVASAAASSDAEIIVNLQGDQPLIEPKDIDRVVGFLSNGFDITTMAYGDDDPAGYLSRDVVKVVKDAAGRALYFSRAPIPSSRTQESGNPQAVADDPGKPSYLHHVGIYCFRRRTLERFSCLPRGELETRENLEQLRALENGMSIGVVVSEHETPSVDRPSDIAAIGRLLEA